MSVRYFAVTCKHGHHGAKRYQPITFVFYAQNAIEACELARDMPGVKHDAPVIECKEITASTYMRLRSQSAYERGGFVVDFKEVK